MFQNKTILLFGDKNNFNNIFIKKFHNEAREIRLLTKDIFDKSYYDIPNLKLLGLHENLNSAFKNVDYVYCCISKDFENLVKHYIKEEMVVVYKSIVDTAINAKVKKVIFISDGSVSMENDIMIKNLVSRKALYLNNHNNFTTSLVFSLCQTKDENYLVDFAILTTKIANSGDIFLKKALQKETFASKLKRLITKEKSEDQSAFFDAEELSRVEDYWEYLKVPLDPNKLINKRNYFEERIKSFNNMKVREIEEV